MAAGVTVAAEAAPALRAFLEERLSEAVARAASDNGFDVDAAVTAGGVTPGLIEELEKAGPFGSGNPEPSFVLPAHRLVEAAEVGNGHVRVRLKAGDGTSIKGIAFRAASGPLGRALLTNRDAVLHVAGQLAVDRWGGGATPQIRISDVAAVR